MNETVSFALKREHNLLICKLVNVNKVSAVYNVGYSVCYPSKDLKNQVMPTVLKIEELKYVLGTRTCSILIPGWKCWLMLVILYSPLMNLSWTILLSMVMLGLLHCFILLLADLSPRVSWADSSQFNSLFNDNAS